MTTPCSRPCAYAHAHAQSVEQLRAHLLEGYACADTWLAIADLFDETYQQLYCLRRAAEIESDDEDLQLRYLSARLVANPDDGEASAAIHYIKVQQALRGHKTRAMRRRMPARSLGEILSEMRAVGEADLQRALANQRQLKQQGKPRLLGDLLISRRLLAPDTLARALIIQRNERADYGDNPQGLGEYLLAEGHISAHDLEIALTEQAKQRLAGREESIGQILQRQRGVNWAVIEHALQRQREDMIQAFR